jgi:hypothetical protein
MQARWKREYPSFLPVEAEPLPAWLQAPPRTEPTRPTRYVWIVVGMAVVLGLVLGGGYWLSHQRQAPSARVVASPTAVTVELTETPAAAPMPQFAVGLPALSGRATTEPAAAQTPVPAPSQPPQLAVGLRPIAGQPPSDAPTPEPAAEAPPPAEPLPSAVPPAKPHRKAANPQSPTVANPSQSSSFRF